MDVGTTYLGAEVKLPADAVDRLIEEGKLVEVKREWLVGEE